MSKLSAALILPQSLSVWCDIPARLLLQGSIVGGKICRDKKASRLEPLVSSK